LSKKEKLIKRAKLLGVREARDTLIFTTVNYTLYSFWVEYEDGSSDVIECAPISPGESKRKQREQKLLFDKLMDIANQSKDSTSAAPETDTAMLDTLQKIHDLHESGALPDDVFEKKRSEILRKLSDPENQASFAQNVTVVRMGARKCGESKTILIVDGERKAFDLDNIVQFHLVPGEHTVRFERGVVRSNELTFLVTKGSQYKISFTAKMFSIDADLKK
jgi:hypothetical protein